MNTTDMFKAEKMAQLKAAAPQVEAVERVITDYFVTINGVRFDLVDLYNTLSEVLHGSDIIITNETYVTMLKELEVIESAGNHRWMSGATKGENFDEFYQLIKDLYDPIMKSW